MLFTRHEAEGLGYVLSLNMQLSKSDIGALTKGIEFQSAIFVGNKSFGEIAAIAQECEEFLKSLRTKHGLEMPKVNPLNERRIRG